MGLWTQLYRSAVCLGVLASMAAAHTLTTSGNTFRMDGQPFDMWGIRVASAIRDQATTSHLINQLDDYRAHGVNTVTVFYMGSSGGNFDPFSSDGKSIDTAYQGRMEQIIKACDARGMAVIVGIFYQFKVSGTIHLDDWDASKEAVKTVARELKDYDNIIINIANEQNSSSYSTKPWANVRNASDIIMMCGLVHGVDPDRLVGGGGYDHGKNDVIGASSEVDALLFDTIGFENSKNLAARYVAAGASGKPLVNVELFGGITRNYMPQGVFPDDLKDEYRGEVDHAASTNGLYVFFHNNPWCQGPSVGEPIRFDLAGQGTSSDPGIEWYFEYVLARAGNGDTSAVEPDPAPPVTGSAAKFEAESAALSGVTIASDKAGYSGSGYADYRNADGDYIEWSFTMESAGSYPISFKFANGGSGARPLTLTVNGMDHAEMVPFDPTGGWENWQSTSPFTVVLNKGTNTVRLTAAGASGPNVDYLAVDGGGTGDTGTAVDPPVVTGPERYLEEGGILCVEAENYHEKYDRTPYGASLEHYWATETSLSGHSGTGYVNNLPDERCETCEHPNSPKDKSGAELVYRITIQTPGLYKVWVRGRSMGGESNGCHIGIDNVLPYNGAGSNISGFRPYGSWIWEHGYKDYSVEPNIYISAGEHTLHLWGRDDGWRCDKILLGINQNSPPSGTGPAASKLVGGSTSSVLAPEAYTAAVFDAVVTPGPVTADAVIRVNGAVADGSVQVSIVSMTGREVFNTVTTAVALRNGIAWDGGTAGAGMYLVRITAGGHTAVKRVVVAGR